VKQKRYNVEQIVAVFRRPHKRDAYLLGLQVRSLRRIRPRNQLRPVDADNSSPHLHRGRRTAAFVSAWERPLYFYRACGRPLSKRTKQLFHALFLRRDKQIRVQRKRLIDHLELSNLLSKNGGIADCVRKLQHAASHPRLSQEA